MKYKILTCLLFSFIAIATAHAQPTLQKLKANLELPGTQQPVFAKVTVDSKANASLLFNSNNSTQLKPTEAATWLGSQLEFRQGIDGLTEETNRTTEAGDLTITLLRQYYKGIRVEHGTINTTARNGKVAMMQLEFYSIPETVRPIPGISEAVALKNAMDFTGATHFVWQGYTGNKVAFMKPRGEPVIIRTYEDDSSVCLAWKFIIYADEPLLKAKIYVHAETGKVVLNDPIIKHANATGIAATKYSGVQTIIADDGNTDPAKPFRLWQYRNGHNIRVLDYLRRDDKPVTNDTLAVNFTDNDNNWTAAEFNNANQDDAALDAMFNSRITSDYWKLVHNRNGWNNSNSDMIVYVHVNQNGSPLDNAYWNGSTLHLGDGAPGVTGGNPPATSLDDIGHELGHGITEASCNLIYRWESGAMNEGFSDIWAACITNYANQNYAGLTGERVWRLFEKSGNVTQPEAGFRDMENPELLGQPGTYKGLNWLNANYENCPGLNPDNCGVHTNSGVLNKWFYILTQGDTSSNYFNTAYSVAGIGFTKSEKIAYLTSLNLTPNAGYANCRNVSVNAATTLYGAASAELQAVKDAWVAVGVDTTLWTMTDTPIFTTNNFTSIALGKGNYIWAGTSSQGLYVFNGKTWFKKTDISNVRINDIKADKNGGIWVAQSGTTASGVVCTAGGVNYFADSATGGAQTSFYTASTQTNVPTRNVRSLFIDQTRVFDGNNPRIWLATGAYTFTTGGATTNGRIGEGLYASTQFFRSITTGINVNSSSSLGCTAIGGNKNRIWTFVPGNFGLNQILAYDASTKAFLAAYDNTNVSAIPANITVRAIYTDLYKRTWFGLATNAVLVYDELHVWHYINFGFATGSQVNFNAITGSKNGDVYIGTTAGIVYFDHGNGDLSLVESPFNYKGYTTASGLPSNNVTGIAYDSKRFKVWVATSAGIVKWDPLCLGANCGVSLGYRSAITSVGPGNWSNTAIWEDGVLPDSNTVVIIEHDVTVDIDATCFSLAAFDGATVRINSGKKLTIYKKEDPPIFGRGRNRR